MALVLKCFVGVFVTMALLETARSHTYHLGKCPVVMPQPSFEMSKMLGIWYVIEKTSTGSSCITYNFTKGEEPGEYLLRQDSQHFLLGLTPLKHDYKYTGQLSADDETQPARMTVRFPLSVAGSASFIIVGTDYSRYALVFTCQKLTFAHRQSATILSRDKELPSSLVMKLRAQLSSYGVDPFSLSIISQKNCPKHENATVNINIDGDTFSPQSVAGVVRKAGEKIGDGVEFVASAGKDVYHKLSGTPSSSSSSSSHSRVDRSKENLSQGSASQEEGNPNAQVEWLP